MCCKISFGYSKEEVCQNVIETNQKNVCAKKDDRDVLTLFVVF